MTKFGDLPAGAVFSPLAGEPGRFTKTGFIVGSDGFNSVDFERGRVRYFADTLPVVELGQVLQLEFEVFKK